MFVCSFQGTLSCGIPTLSRYQVENTRFELVTSCLQGRRSPNWANPPRESGSHLFSHAVSSIVPSAAQVLTIVFGMGTGVSPKRIATRNTIWPFYRTNNLHLVLRASCSTSNPLRFFSVDSSLHMSHSCFKWFSKQVCFLIFTVLSRAQSLMTK